MQRLAPTMPGSVATLAACTKTWSSISRTQLLGARRRAPARACRRRSRSRARTPRDRSSRAARAPACRTSVATASHARRIVPPSALAWRILPAPDAKGSEHDRTGEPSWNVFLQGRRDRDDRRSGGDGHLPLRVLSHLARRADPRRDAVAGCERPRPQGCRAARHLEEDRGEPSPLLQAVRRPRDWSIIPPSA